MGRFIFLWVSVAITGFCSRVDATGRITSADSGSELKIECWVNGKKLYFTLPEAELIDPRSTHQILNGSDGNYTFIRSKTVIKDTGWYACAKGGIEIDRRSRIRNRRDNSGFKHHIYVRCHICPLLRLSVDDPQKPYENTFASCRASGSPIPTISWSYQSSVYPSEDNSTTIFQRFRMEKDEINQRITSHVKYIIRKSGFLKCKACNKNGCTMDFKEVHVPDASEVAPSPGSPWHLIIIAAVALVFLVFIIFCMFMYKREMLPLIRKVDAAFRNGAPNRLNPRLSVADQAELLPYDRQWEIPKQRISFGKTLREGAFGVVKKARAKSIRPDEGASTVTVKLGQLIENPNVITVLSRELKVLCHIGKHLNLVNLLGACTANISYGEIIVIVEFCRFGNLHDYLRNRRKDFLETDEICSELNIRDSRAARESNYQHINIQANDRNQKTESGDASGLKSRYQGDYSDRNLKPISTNDLGYWAWQISRGMEYLGRRRVVHGDLAAKNVLLADNGIVKVSDFGLSRATYKDADFKNEDDLPVKWMAIECIKNKTFSLESDVWSFGIVLWELFTLGETPYPDIKPEDLYQRLLDGHRMEWPRRATRTIYDMMLQCWNADRFRRPSFATIANILGDLLDESIRTKYLELSLPYMKMNADFFAKIDKDYLTLTPFQYNGARKAFIGEEWELENITAELSRH